MSLFKRVVKLLFVFGLIFSGIAGFNTSKVSADSKEVNYEVLTSEQLKEINVKLEEMKNDINLQLSEGKEDVFSSRKVSFSDEPLIMAFNSVDNFNGNGFALAAQQKKNFSGYVANTFPGAGFKHTVSGWFLYGSGKVGNYDYDPDLTGPLYSKSNSTKANRLDDSVVRITSSGTFKALKYAPVEYTTKVVIELYGSGTYRVVTAKIN
ncbi:MULTISPECIES: hypothetical protein [Bacillus cereus group]|uniref:hypothetical protein n=2 Tax=Bacillus TaxID=1386 RepID=UPI00226E1F13|nr:hypothetical protein [Bacillus anthracis]MCX9103347.1 hypothetical protein [Bacillus anthracis]MDA2672443.1 hypothetical protein [Bacillus cereus]